MPLQNDLVTRSGMAEAFVKPGAVAFGALSKPKEGGSTSESDRGTTGSSYSVAAASMMKTAKPADTPDTTEGSPEPSGNNAYDDSAVFSLGEQKKSQTKPQFTDEVNTAKTLANNWDKYDIGKMSGTDFSAPKSDLPQPVQDALKFVNDDTTLYNAMIKGNGGKDGDPLTKADVEKFVKDAVADKHKAGDLVAPWDRATASSDKEAFGLSDTQKADLNKPLQPAQSLVENWHTWGLSSGVSDFGKLPDDIPQQGKDMLGIIESNPALMKAIGGDDGKITQDKVVAFVHKATDDAKAGVTSLNDFLKSNPDVPDATKRLAQSAAIVRGNETLLSSADPGDKKAGHGDLTQADLYNFVGHGATQYNQGSTLRDAANLWLQPGFFRQLDTAGEKSSVTKPDGIANGGGIETWIAKQAPAITGPTLGAFLADAANRSLTFGADISKLGPDFFDHLSDNHDGAQKLAVLQQLSDIDAKVTAGVDSSVFDSNLLGTNNDPKQVHADIAGKIALLAADPDVQKLRADHFGGDLQNLVASDPSLHGAIQSYYNGDIQSGKALNDALGAKDGNGQPISVEQGLQAFMQTATTLDLAMGSKDARGMEAKPLQGLDLQKIIEKSGKQDALKDAYTNDILSGDALKDAIDKGTDVGSAVQQFQLDAANFGAVLPTQYVADNAGTLQRNFSDQLSNGIEGNATKEDLDTAFAGKDGKIDTQKLTDALDQAMKADPSFGSDGQGNQFKPSQIMAAVNSVVTDVRNGVKLQDALAKLSKATADDWNNQPMPVWRQEAKLSPPSGAAAEAYKKGFMHAVGAVVNGGILIAKSVETGGKATPQASASILGSSFQMFGGALEAGSKYATAEKVGPLSKDALKTIESAGKTIGGAGSIIGGALGIFSGVQSLQAGDKANGGASLATGITGSWSGVSSLIEGGVGLADAALGSIGADSAALAATSATLGIVGGVTTLLAFTGLGIYGLVEGAERVNDYTDKLKPELQQFGITGGTAPSSNPPHDNAPPGEA